MMTFPDLDTRLRRHHEALVAAFTGHPLPAREPARARGGRRVLLASVAIAAALGVAVPVVTLRLLPGRGSGQTTVQVAGFTIVAAADASATPRMTSAEAVAALKSFWARVPLKLPDGTLVTGIHVGGTAFVPGVDRVMQPCIHVAIPRRENLWVISVTAPAQGGWRAIHGGYLVSDADGSIAGGDLLFSPQNGASPC